MTAADFPYLRKAYRAGYPLEALRTFFGVRSVRRVLRLLGEPVRPVWKSWRRAKPKTRIAGVYGEPNTIPYRRTHGNGE